MLIKYIGIYIANEFVRRLVELLTLAELTGPA